MREQASACRRAARSDSETIVRAYLAGLFAARRRRRGSWGSRTYRRRLREAVAGVLIAGDSVRAAAAWHALPPSSLRRAVGLARKGLRRDAACLGLNRRERP